MKNFSFSQVDLIGGFLHEKQKLNRKITINAVYDRFLETGRIGAFDCNYTEGDKIVPHKFWDSDVAKWMEGVAYILQKHKTPELEEKVDRLIARIKQNQCDDGYFNLYHTLVRPDLRWQNRDNHELYCAGHLMEAAVAYAEATGKTDFLACMEKYADYIDKVFIQEKSAAFATPGHEEIELALLRMYHHTGKKKYLDMAAYFINTRGTVEEQVKDNYNQSHLPVRKQRDAVGHAVRALYLYTAMAHLAADTSEAELTEVCQALFDDVTRHKMYITGGFGSTSIGEAFTVPFDLPNDQAYTETCAGIAMIYFASAMQRLDHDACYADVIERVLYNGLLSALSLDGKAFFYENPLEINLSERFENRFGKRRFPQAARKECFGCSCCPPNINRLLPSLGNYLYGIDGDTLYIHQFAASELHCGDIRCTQETVYPQNGAVKIKAEGVGRLAVRIPSWCNSFHINHAYTMQNGYAVIDAAEAELLFDMPVHTVYADARVIRNAGCVAVMRGPVVYCAESVDNGENLHAFRLPTAPVFREIADSPYGLCTIEADCERCLPFADGLYSSKPPKTEKTTLKLIPYNAFANRGECDMLVWLHTK